MSLANALQADLLDANPTASIILLGRDSSNKPHASWFCANEAELAKTAATAMGMHAEPVNSDALRALAGQLPRGKLFASGKAFVPFVRASLFDELLAEVPLAARLKPLRLVKDDDGGTSNPVATIRPKAAGPKAEPKRPTDWDGIDVGNIVLATTGGVGEGWFECIVLKTNPDLTIDLRWRDFDEEPTFTQHRHQVALLYPRPTAAA